MTNRGGTENPSPGDTSTGRRRRIISFVKDSTITAAAQVLSAVSAVVVQALIVRCFGVEAFGSWVGLQTIAAIIESSVVARAGEVALYSLHWAERDRTKKADRVINSLLWSELRWTLPAAVGTIIALVLFDSERKFPFSIYFLFACSLFSQTGYGVYKSILLLEGRIVAQATIDSTTAVVNLILMWLATSSGRTDLVAASLALSALVKTFLTGRAVHDRLRQANTAEVLPIENMNRTAWTALARNGLTLLSQQLDVLLLAFLSPPAALSIYRVAKTVAALPSKAFFPLWVALRPRLLEAMRQGRRRGVYRLIGILSAAILLFGCVAVPVAYAIAPWFLSWAYGETFRAAAVPFMVLLVGTWIFFGACGWFGFLIVLSHQKSVGLVVQAMTIIPLLVVPFFDDPSAKLTAFLVVGGYLLSAAGAVWWLLRAAEFDGHQA